MICTVIKNLVVKVKNILKISLFFLYDCSLLLIKNKILLVGFFNERFGKITNNNWGDDINYFFFKEICSCKVIPHQSSFLYHRLSVKNYSFIGSILCSFTNKNTIVWGSGLINGNVDLEKLPSKIYSVRGPLTRETLLKNGINCPEKYGDPALLISKYYKPSLTKKYKLGLILHYVDEDNPIINSFIKNHKDVLLIRMRGYSHWHDIPDQVCSCERIASTSLHGLIVADTYNIPNLWIRLSDKIYGGDFKYKDYFMSVKREIDSAYQVKDWKDVEFIYLNTELFSFAACINYDDIYDACPIKDKLRKWDL